MSPFGLVDENKRETEEAFATPTRGMRFTEMYSFLVYVVEVSPSGVIVTREGSPPCVFPDGAKRCVYPTEDAFRERFSYGSIPGYWVRWVDDDNDVRGWANEAEPTTEASASAGEQS